VTTNNDNNSEVPTSPFVPPTQKQEWDWIREIHPSYCESFDLYDLSTDNPSLPLYDAYVDEVKAAVGAGLMLLALYFLLKYDFQTNNREACQNKIAFLS